MNLMLAPRLLLCLAILGVALAAQSAAPAAAPAAGPASPRVTYTRSFPNSDPVYVQIEVGGDGSALYAAREQAGEPLMRFPFTASPATVRAVFGDAAALKDFQGSKLQSKDNVAFTGAKTLAYDGDGVHSSQSFNYTTLPPAAALVSLFDRISTTGMDALRLQRAAQYQPLDVPDALEQIQSDWSLHEIAEPQLLMPVLVRVTGDTNQMDAARHHADKLLAAMRKR